MEEGPPPHLITGQRVAEAKLIRARQLRRQMTPSERRLWQRLRRGQIGGHFRRQQVVFGFIADFYSNVARLVVEVDGAVHDLAYDAERDRVFRQGRVRVLRFSNDDVEQRLGYVLARITQELYQTPPARRGSPPPRAGEDRKS